jgi:hypothetical protein
MRTAVIGPGVIFMISERRFGKHARWKKMWGIVACAATGALTGCNGVHSASTTAPVVCDTPGATGTLHDAICNGDKFALHGALSGPQRREDMNVVVRLWDSDKSYGRGLPWPSLESRRDRVEFALYLALALRNRDIDSPPLRDLQQFALQVVQTTPRDGDGDNEQLLWDGLRLLGRTNSAGEVGLLRGFAASSGEPLERRREAIYALGEICAPEAGAALQELKQAASRDHNPVDAAIVKFVDGSLSVREVFKLGACRDSRSTAG